MKVFKDISEIRKWADTIRAERKSLGFVPTMGALHIAHAELIKTAEEKNDFVIVSIFVNPTQFGPGEDYDSYPENFEKDKELCKNTGVDAVFYPDISEMYPREYSTTVKVSDITETMCGKCRPGHFEGVATVVAKLFNIINPHRVYLGQKDYQQYRVIERMVGDLNFDLKLVMCPTVREKDGLAVSSRNQYLSEAGRCQAPCIYRELKECEKLIKKGIKEARLINEKIKSIIKENIPECKIDYAGVYDACSLKHVDIIKGNVVIATAVWVGKARLIDNIVIKIGD